MRSLNIDARHAVRSADLAARWETVLRGLEHASDGGTALGLADDADKLLESSTDSAVLRNWRLACNFLRAVAVDLAVRAAARGGSTDVAADRQRLQVILHEVDDIVGELDDEPLQAELRGAYDASIPQVNKKALLSALAKLPLPSLYLAEEPDRWPRRIAADAQITAIPKIPVLRLAAFLDNTPVAPVQLLRPHTLHTLRFQVRGSEWPMSARRFWVELLSTCPPSLFHVSAFETAERSGAPDFEATVAGSIQLNVTQSEAASDVAVVVRAAFTMEDGSVHEAPVVGHSQLRFRISASGDAAPGKDPPAASAIGGLPPGQFAALQDALLAAYNRDSLKRMLRIKLDIRLDHIAGNGTFTDVVCDVIDWAEREGRVELLVKEAAAFVPGNAQLQRFHSAFENQVMPLSPTHLQ